MKAIKLLCGKSLSISLVVLISTITLIMTGCGMSGPPPPAFSGNTNITVLLSSTANDQVSQFGLTFNSLSLSNKAGKVFNLIANPQTSEFIHLNGSLQPLGTVAIPQEVYSSATATVGYAYFTCVTLIPATGTPPGGLLMATYAYGSTPNAQVSLRLPSPITVTGTNMGILVNMAISQSESLGSCYAPPGYPNPYSINPTFTVTPILFSAQTQNEIASVENDLNGEISAVRSYE